MAKCIYKLPEDLLRKLSLLGNNIEPITEKVLNAGAEVAFKYVKSNLESVISNESTGELVSSLGISSVRIDRNGDPNIKIGFKEPRKDGSSNAMVANIIEYGKHNQQPRPFLAKAKRQSKNPCIETMTSVLKKEIDNL